MMPFAILAERLNQQERLDALRRWSGGSDADGPWVGLAWLLVAAAVVVGILYLASSMQPARKKKPRDDRSGLFKGAMSHLRLEAKTRRLLSRLASEAKLDHPVHLLMSPKLFDEITEAWLDTLPPQEARRRRPLLDDARAQVYGGEDWQACRDRQ